MAPTVVWLLSPIRSGSSITVYGAAEGLGAPVADEPFGPWDRTGAPYHYPPVQRDLRDAFESAGKRLTPEVVSLAGQFFETVGSGSPRGVVICKHPHESIGPDDIRRAFPGHRWAVLLRNPLHALNSLFTRGWEDAAGGGDMLGYFSTIARRWLAEPDRLNYDELKRDPEAFYARLFRAWGLPEDPDAVQRAAAYRRRVYHHNSRGTSAEEDTSRVRSEREWRLPQHITDAYLNDPLMREVFQKAGWNAAVPA